MPQTANTVMAVTLAALVCVQVWAQAHWGANPTDGSASPGPLSFLLAAGSYLPLVVRRRLPLVTLVVSGACAFAYLGGTNPPAYVLGGPMLAVYSLAVYARRTLALPLALASLTLVGAGLALTVSGDGWVTRAGGAFALLAAAAFAGVIQRSRRAYTKAVEERAAEAERTREEEALRRAEEERLRIARDVHDVVAHTLSAVIVQADAGLQVIDRDPETARGALENIAASSRHALSELRATLRVLRSGETDAEREPARGLADLDALLAPARAAGLRTELDVDVDGAETPAYIGASAYRIVQEAVTNALRHAQASSLRARVALENDTLEIEIADDGIGGDAPDGHGLAGMRERVAALGGTCAAGARPEGGFLVTASIPLAGGERETP